MSRTPILPTEEEAAGLLLGPDSLAWRSLGDPRYFFGAGYALMLQVAHPTVGSGVRDHSNFQADPWGRLMRTTDYLYLLVYGGQAAAADGAAAARAAQVDQGHQPRRQPLPRARARGLRLGPRDPDRGLVRRRRALRRPASAPPIATASTPSTCRSGGWSACAPATCPRPGPEFRDYVDTMIAERLVRHETVDLLLSLLGNPAPPGLPVIDQLWPLLRVAPVAGAEAPRPSGCCRRCCASASASLDRGASRPSCGRSGRRRGRSRRCCRRGCATSGPSTCAAAARRSPAVRSAPTRSRCSRAA